MCGSLADMTPACAPGNNMKLCTFLCYNDVVDMLDCLTAKIKAGLDRENIACPFMGDDYVPFRIVLFSYVFCYLILIHWDCLPVILVKPVIFFHRSLIGKDFDTFLTALSMNNILVHLEITAATVFHGQFDTRLDEPFLVLV